MLTHRLARPLLAGLFVVDGLDALLHPDAKVQKAEAVTSKVTRFLGLPDNTKLLIRLTGGVQVGAGILMAMGVLPRPMAASLAASLVPVTIADHPFWLESDPAIRAGQRTQFLKNASILGGLILAANDTEGRPSVGWRAHRALEHTAARVSESASRRGAHAASCGELVKVPQRAIAGFALAVMLAACSDDGGAVSNSNSTTNGTTAGSIAAATTTGVPATTAPVARNYDFAKPEVIATGLTVPWGIAFLPDGSALVAERISGRILQLRAGSAPQAVMTVPGVNPNGEGGLLGLATSLTYAQDGLVYAYFTSTSDNRVARFRLGATPEVILSGIAASSVHNGGRIAFGPDGFLYVTTGDAATSSRAQDPTSINGKILRVKADGSPAPGNPIAGSPVWSLGHRNVQGIAWDASGRLFATEFGAGAFDEVNLIEPGKNYGWPTVEGVGNNAAFVNPLVTWSTSEASPSGAAISGNTLYVGALAGRRLWKIPITAAGLGTPQAMLEGQFGRLRTVVNAPDGSLWVATSNRDGRGSPTADDDRILRFAPTN